MVFDPSGRLLLSAGSDTIIRVYDLQTGTVLHELKGHTLVPHGLDFSPNGKLLASAGDDKTIKIWDTNTWQLVNTLEGENQALHSVLFVDNDRVVAGGTDKKLLGELLEYHFGFEGWVAPITATLWDVHTEKILQTVTEPTDDIGLGMDVSADGKFIATPNKDSTVQIWSLKL